MKVKISVLIVLFQIINSFSQVNTESKYSFLKPSDSLNSVRKTTVLVAESTLIGSGLILLNNKWYQDKEKSSFHFNRDHNSWAIMDKAAHGFATYQLTRITAESFQWAGVEHNKSLVFGAAFGLGTTTIKEVLDGFTQEWGWSWLDYGFNVIGSGIYVGQEMLWKEQRIQPKFSYNNRESKGIITPNVGSGFDDRLFKNYDGQTFWLSFNVNSFLKTTYIPNWLNFSLGYGVDGYLRNEVDLSVPQKSKSLYVSFDVDLTKIKTNSHLLKTVFSVVNSVKIPAPTIQFNSKKGTTTHLFYF